MAVYEDQKTLSLGASFNIQNDSDYSSLLLKNVNKAPLWITRLDSEQAHLTIKPHSIRPSK